MTIYDRAEECVPQNTWNEIIEKWKRRYPDPNEYVRLSGGDNVSIQEWASELNFRRIPFTCTNSIPFLAAFGFGLSSGYETSSDFSLSDTDESPKITFLSLPKEFVIVSMSEFDRIKYYDGMVYYMDVPIPVLSKMNELGKLFTK